MINERSLANLKPFAKGDPRINRAGPKNFAQLRAIVQQLLSAPAIDKRGQPILDADGNPVSNLDVLLRKWLTADDPRLPIRLLEIAYGKVPDRISVTDEEGRPRQFQIIEVVKDRGDGTVVTARAISTVDAPALASSPALTSSDDDAIVIDTETLRQHDDLATRDQGAGI